MESPKTPFQPVKRQTFREYFQPSRIVLAVIEDGIERPFNIITLCFASHAAYKPPAMVFSIEKRHYSHQLLIRKQRLVIAVPGERLAGAALFCGTNSGYNLDKANRMGLAIQPGIYHGLPFLSDAIANLDVSLAGRMDGGDHTVFLAEVNGYYVGPNIEHCLLSIGSQTKGYRILAQSGLHRIAIPNEKP
jgi:flavin reductase (DIM6/NTAB) family NADH-FMN oxidoreductase RutF